MNTPTVAVVLPAYNAQDTVRSAIHSLQRQTLADFELIVVDDGSTDDTPTVLQDLAGGDDRLHIHRTTNQGIIAALNTGIARCAAPLIARMDADDLSHSRRLEWQAAYLQAHPEISVCSSRIAMFPRSVVRGGMWRYQEWLNGMVSHDDIARNIFVESPVVHPSVMVRREELLAVGAYQDRGWAEDYDLWLRYYLAGYRFAKLPQTLLAWRHTGTRLTFADSRYSVDNFLRAKAHYLAGHLGNLSRPLYLWGAGKTGARLLKHLQRAGLQITAIIEIDPRKIGGSKRGVPVVARESLTQACEVFVITAVSSLGARALIREYLCALDFVEGRDFLCAA